MLVPKRFCAKRSAFALVDVCVALAILAVALGTLVGSVFWAMRLEEVNEEKAAASQRLRALLEEFSALPIEDVYAAYNADPSDDPPGYDARAVLEIHDPLLVVGKKESPTVLVSFHGNEAELDPDATVLPITLRLEWEGASGPCNAVVSTVLRGP